MGNLVTTLITTSHIFPHFTNEIKMRIVIRFLILVSFVGYCLGNVVDNRRSSIQRIRKPHLGSLSAFHDFMSSHNKTYSSREEYKSRYRVFKSNMKIVERLQAMLSMARLNLTGAKLMHKYKAGAATDVTGFGILGHAVNLAENQLEEVSFSLHTLPVIKNMVNVSKAVGNMFQLLQGYSAETSGGLLLAIGRENAEAFIKDIKEIEGCDAWVIGDVESGPRTAKIADNPTIIEV